MPERTCLACGDHLVGRADKKFCSDQCRSAHNNNRNSDVNNFMRTVNNSLRRNRRILDSLNPGGRVKVSGDRLLEAGFDFRYYTSTRTMRDGTTCFYCYDQGYVPLGKNYFQLILSNDGTD